MTSGQSLCVTLLTVMAAPTASLASGWQYSQRTDPMNGKVVVSAEIASTNELQFHWPYDGRQRGQLLIEEGSRGELIVLVGIGRGQFICRTGGCSIRLRFDGGPPRSYHAVSPADGSTNVVFVLPAADIVGRVRKASSLRVEGTFYQEGDRVLEFDVSGLTWEETHEEAVFVKAQRFRAARHAAFLRCDRGDHGQVCADQLAECVHAFERTHDLPAGVSCLGQVK